MQQFLLVAAAHFLALLSPGPDFFLIARTSAHEGWRVASGACIGIACANGVFIVAAFAGVSALRPGGAPFVVLQLAGAAYLLYLGTRFLLHAGADGLDRLALDDGVGRGGASRRAAGMGFLSGILNPKNALFYVSLASMLGSVPLAGRVLYGVWMFGAVLAWDMLVAALIGNPMLLRRFSRALPWIERMSGGVLVLLALGVLAHLLKGG